MKYFLVAAVLLGAVGSGRAEAQLAADRASTFSVELTSSFATQSVQPNEKLDGSLTGVLLQAAHPLGTWAGLQWHYVFEATPFISAHMGASGKRLLEIGPGLREQYARRSGVGFGVAPLGIRMGRPLGVAQTSRTAAMLEMVGGGAHYTKIMPYGEDATRNNYTFEAKLMLERRLKAGALAAGVGLHHISNGGFGKANPGINAKMVMVRWTRRY